MYHDTGIDPDRAVSPPGKGGLLRENMVTLGEAMKLAGYQTALSGKWHLGSGETTHPYRRGFDEYYGLLDGCCNFFNPKQRDPKYKGGRIRKFGHNDRDLSEFPDDYYTTDAFTDHAIECLEKFTKTASRTSCTSTTRRRTTRCMPSRRTSRNTSANSGWAGIPCVSSVTSG